MAHKHEAAACPSTKTPIKSILMDSPVSSELRVTFDDCPRVKEISYNNGAPVRQKAPKYEVKDRTIILNKKMIGPAKLKAKKYVAMIPSHNSVVLKYKRKEDLDVDLRALGLKPKTYIENKILVYGLGYRETEESVKAFFGVFADVERVVLEKNSKNFCTGKATVTFSTHLNTNQEFRLNNRLLRIERIKKQIVNRTRLFISHMAKTVKISDLRSALKQFGFVPKDIRIDLQDGRNKGYGFVEFDTPEDAEAFIQSFSLISPSIGKDSRVELSHEKNLNKK